MKAGRQSWKFNDVYLLETATAVGPLESQGPLKDDFDVMFDEPYCGQKSWEQAESQLMRSAITKVIEKAKIQENEISVAFAGDLVNQIVPTHYTFRETNIPFFGIYGACSTSMESLMLSALMVDSDNAKIALAATSSHNSSAERQYRNPTEYGGPKPETAQYTVTGSGVALVSHKKTKIRIESATAGIIVDAAQNNPNDMGAAMAPAAAHTIKQHFVDLGVDPSYYDLILTGDLASCGSPIVVDILRQEGYDISEQHNDCGKLVF